MQIAESIEQMAINSNEIKSDAGIKDLFGEYQSFDSFMGQTKALQLDVVQVTKFIVLLYSEDSVLNTRPTKALDERQARAAKMAGFIPKNNRFASKVQINLFDLSDAHIFSFIFEYLTKGKKFLWQDIITLETQMLENQKLRMRPVAEEKGKDDLSASAAKDKMLDLLKKWRAQLEEYYDEFYGDNEKLRAIHRINRDNMATLENYAI